MNKIKTTILVAMALMSSFSAFADNWQHPDAMVGTTVPASSRTETMPMAGVNMPATPSSGAETMPMAGMNMPATPSSRAETMPMAGMNMPATPSSRAETMPMGGGMNMPATPSSKAETMPMGGMNMQMAEPQGRMSMMGCSQRRHIEMMHQYMQDMETHLANIEILLRQLVEQKKEQAK